MNVHGRHLTEAARATIAAKLAKPPQGRPKQNEEVAFSETPSDANGLSEKVADTTFLRTEDAAAAIRQFEDGMSEFTGVPLSENSLLVQLKPQSLERGPMAANITNVFVLMLENRSFDHMLGFSGITGKDAETGAATSVDGLKGNETNSYQGQSYPVVPSADDTMPIDPGHEFPDVVKQLSGENAVYPLGGPYPPIDNSGFVADYAKSPSAFEGEGSAPSNFGEIMKCFSPVQLPVLNALARAFAVCDNWHAFCPRTNMAEPIVRLRCFIGGPGSQPNHGGNGDLGNHRGLRVSSWFDL